MIAFSQVEQIKQLLAAGVMSERAIADRVGVSRYSVKVVRKSAEPSDESRWETARLRAAYFLSQYRRSIPHRGNLVTSLKFRDSGILWEEKREQLGIKTLEETRPERSQRVGRCSPHSICNMAPFVWTPQRVLNENVEPGQKWRTGDLYGDRGDA